MIYPAMPTVECLRVDAIELVHGFGQTAVRYLQQQMEVIGHQTIDMSNHVEPPQRRPEHGEKGFLSMSSLKMDAWVLPREAT
jgi:hypothetical protein